MNALDIFFTILFGFSLIRGIFRGLVKEVASVIGVLTGYYAAYSYYPLVASLISRWFTNTAYLNVISFLILFSLIFLIISVIGVVLKYLLSIAYLGWADRISGAAFGILKSVLIASVLLVALTAFLPKNAAIIRNSILAPHVTVVSEYLAVIVSKDMKSEFQTKLEALKASWRTSR